MGKNMKIVHVSFSDSDGGAFRAAYRIHQSLQHTGMHSRFWVARAVSADPAITGPTSYVARAVVKMRHRLVRQLFRLHGTANGALHSYAMLNSSWPNLINNSDADIVHLHWINNEMLSIADIARIKKPVVWTLHDMWAFCGAEHYAENDRWIEGYHRDNRPASEWGLDLNRWTYNRKKKAWKPRFRIVAPSRWLENCVRQSALLKDHKVSVIPYPIDTDVWRPIEPDQARDSLGLSVSKPLLVYAAMGGAREKIKGFDLLLKALASPAVRDIGEALQVVVLGQDRSQTAQTNGIIFHYPGRVSCDLTLRAYYSAANAVIIPSRLDNLPNVAIEAQSCGTVVVAFDVGGLGDLVDHLHTGYLATAMDTDDLANGIKWALNYSRSGSAPTLARERAERHYSNDVVGNLYKSIYHELLAAKGDYSGPPVSK